MSARELAEAIYREILSRIRGDVLVRRCLSLQGDSLEVGGTKIGLQAFERVLLCGAGKASAGMAQAVEQVLGTRIDEGLVITKDGHSLPLERVRVLETAHPTPDERSLDAGSRMLELADSCSAGDLVLFVLSGGASSLMEALPAGETLEGLRQRNTELLASGAPIDEVNRERRRHSLLKGGKLAERFAPATVVCLVLSDVYGNDLATIGSGPLYSEHLRVPHVIVGDLDTLILEAITVCAEHDLLPRHLASGDLGEACVFGAWHAEQEGDCLLACGEPTVTLKGGGMGGRAQEAACAASAVIAGDSHTAFLAAGTDGTDGPTDAAGAIVDGETAARTLTRPEDALKTNDTYPYHRTAGSLLITGPTQTNLTDLYLLIRH